MRVAFDTNVLISAYTARGLSADVFRLTVAEHHIVIPAKVLSEFERVMAEKFQVPLNVVQEFADGLRMHHIQSQTGDYDAAEIRDPDDRLVAAQALAAGSDILITGDSDLLEAREHLAPMKVYTPREFWESLRQARPG